MDILIWIVFGLIVGVVANILDPKPSSEGLLGTVVLGVLGAVLGGLLGDLIFGVTTTGINISSFVISLGGTLLLLAASRALRRV